MQTGIVFKDRSHVVTGLLEMTEDRDMAEQTGGGHGIQRREPSPQSAAAVDRLKILFCEVMAIDGRP